MTYRVTYKVPHEREFSIHYETMNELKIGFKQLLNANPGYYIDDFDIIKIGENVSVYKLWAEIQNAPEANPPNTKKEPSNEA